MNPVVMTHVVRDGIVESEHHGSAVAVRNGTVVAAMGDVERHIYYRSSQKPFQTTALLESGAIERFKLEEYHIAIASGSIDANERQIEIVADMLKRGGLTENDLQCPPSLPLGQASRHRAVKRGEEKRRLLHNCAGKHAGMLLASLAYGAPPSRYLEPDHPVQRCVARHLEAALRRPDGKLSPSTFHWGGDGCGTPVLAASLPDIAYSFSRLAKPDAALPGDVAEKFRRISRAMARFPEMVGGDDHRPDTEIMRVGKGDIVAKGGAEGLLCIARLSDGLAIALKANDGQDRGLRPAAIAWLRMLGVISDPVPESLRQFEREVVNSRGTRVVGEVCYCGGCIERVK